jgi:hypothetical protein
MIYLTQKMDVYPAYYKRYQSFLSGKNQALPLIQRKEVIQMDKTSPKTLQNWAVFRFSVVGGLLARPPEKGELQKELGLLAERIWHHPITNQQVKFGVSTIERWYYRARGAMDPVQAMARKIRSDAGHNSAMPASQLSELDRQYKLELSTAF